MRSKPGEIVGARLAESTECESEVLGFYFADKVKPLKAAPPEPSVQPEDLSHVSKRTKKKKNLRGQTFRQ